MNINFEKQTRKIGIIKKLKNKPLFELPSGDNSPLKLESPSLISGTAPTSSTACDAKEILFDKLIGKLWYMNLIAQNMFGFRLTICISIFKNELERQIDR